MRTTERPAFARTEEAVKALTPEQYRVTQQDGTERPFRNAYWDNKDPGLYVDVVSGEPLFASVHKFDSGTGWPSFWQPVEPGNIVEKTDRGLFMTRTEVRSAHGDSHLGHVFPDGPRDRGACATASTRRRCASCRWTASRPRATTPIARSSRADPAAGGREGPGPVGATVQPRRGGTHSSGR